ncbi:MAG: winged helix-turn-helix transcriptional regulator [Nitrososphaerota archaeon]|nr:winged helix-turn-helix transcriptional regulator [Nitrososphaerota archaeon]
MKRLMILDQNGSLLLSDVLNQRIVRQLVLSPYSSTELSRKLGVPAVKMWRRIAKLLEAKIVEPYEVEHVGNLEKKIYRATALRYIPLEFLNFEPKSKELKDAYKLYLEITNESLKRTLSSNEIPQSMSFDVVDYGVYTDLKNFCHVMLDPKTQSTLRRLDKQLAECKQFEISPVAVSRG